LNGANCFKRRSARSIRPRFIGIALGNVEFAPDHLVARERIAVDV